MPEILISVKSVKVINTLCLLVTFSTGEQRVFDAEPLLKYPIYEPLKNDNVFNSVYIDYGTVTWNDGEIDIASETLYKESYEYSKKAI